MVWKGYGFIESLMRKLTGKALEGVLRVVEAERRQVYLSCTRDG